MVEKNPDDHEARFKLAQALHGSGQVEDAVDQLLELFKIDSVLPAIIYPLSAVCCTELAWSSPDAPKVLAHCPLQMLKLVMAINVNRCFIVFTLLL